MSVSVFLPQMRQAYSQITTIFSITLNVVIPLCLF